MMIRTLALAVSLYAVFAASAAAEKASKPGKRQGASLPTSGKLYVPKQGKLLATKAKRRTVTRSASVRSEWVWGNHYKNWGYNAGIVETTGYAPGDELHLEEQVPSDDLGVKPGSPGMRDALRKATKFEAFDGMLVDRAGITDIWSSRFTLGDFSDPEQKVQRQFLLTPRVLNGRPLWVNGPYRVVMKRDGKTIGIHPKRADSNTPFVNKNNVYVTPVYLGPDGEPEAVLLGLAAFPIGATIVVTDMTKLRDGLADHTFTANASVSTGSARLVLSDARPGHEYSVSVGDGKLTTFSFRLPAHNDPIVKKRGLSYIELKHFAVSHDL